MIAPRFTVAIFVQDAELHLERALSSVLSQPGALEVIALDAGSADDSEPQLREWARQDERVRVVKLARCAQAEAFNLAITLARGEQLAFLDAHDWLPEGTLQALEATEPVELLVGGLHPLAQESLKTELVRRRRRAWGAWFGVRFLRESRARLSARLVDLDLVLMLDVLAGATRVTAIEHALIRRGAPSSRSIPPPPDALFDERMESLRHLLSGARTPAALEAARDEGLELAQLLDALPASSRAPRTEALRALMTSALGGRWPIVQAGRRLEHAVRSLLKRSADER